MNDDSVIRKHDSLPPQELNRTTVCSSLLDSRAQAPDCSFCVVGKDPFLIRK